MSGEKKDLKTSQKNSSIHTNTQNNDIENIENENKKNINKEEKKVDNNNYSNNIDKIEKIQNIYRKNKFIEEFKKNKDIFLKLNKLIDRNSNNLFEKSNLGLNFDSLTVYIRKKEVIESVSKLIKCFYSMIDIKTNNSTDIISYKITPKILLSMYVIYGYPEFTLSKSKIKIQEEKEKLGYNYDIYILSEKLFTNLNNLMNDDKNENLRLFVKSINMFSNCFVIWFNHDKIKKINELTTEWINMNETISEVNLSDKYDEDQKKKTVEVINNSQKNIEKLLLKINKNFDLNSLKIISALKKQLQDNYDKSYWDLLSKELEEEKYEFLEKILLEIQNEIIKLRKRNQSFVDDFKDKYDVKFIIQLIKDKVFDFNNLLSYTNYLVNLIIEMQAPIRNNTTKEEWNNIIKKLEQGELGGFNSCVPVLLKYILVLINDIKEDIINIHIANSMNIKL